MKYIYFDPEIIPANDYARKQYLQKVNMRKNKLMELLSPPQKRTAWHMRHYTFCCYFLHIFKIKRVVPFYLQSFQENLKTSLIIFKFFNTFQWLYILYNLEENFMLMMIIWESNPTLPNKCWVNFGGNGESIIKIENNITNVVWSKMCEDI